MTIVQPQIKYDFPKGEPPPFDLKSNAKYFIYASGYSNISDNISDFSLDNLNLNIPFGYKTVLLLQRICVVNNSELIKYWGGEGKKGNEIIGKFIIFSNIILRFFSKLGEGHRNIFIL